MSACHAAATRNHSWAFILHMAKQRIHGWLTLTVTCSKWSCSSCRVHELSAGPLKLRVTQLCLCWRLGNCPFAASCSTSSQPVPLHCTTAFTTATSAITCFCCCCACADAGPGPDAVRSCDGSADSACLTAGSECCCSGTFCWCCCC